MNVPFIDLQTQYKSCKEKIDASIHRVLEHGQYIMGPEVGKLEARLADYIGVKYVLACSSGTDALVLPLMAKNLGEGDAVFTSPFTFFASTEAISLAGATPVFVDIDPDTYNMDPVELDKQIQRVLSEGKLKPKGIIPVDLFGIAANYNEINELALKYDLFVLEDAAQSFGAPYHGEKAGSLAEVAATSFYPAKPLGCYGDGGAVFTNDTHLYETMVSLRVHGQSTSGDKYDNTRIGLNARMDTIQAAILIEKLKLFDHEIELRNKVADQYSELLCQDIKTPFIPQHQRSVWAQYSIQSPKRDQIRQKLSDNGIPTAVFYSIPIHLSTAYKSLGYSKGDYPVSEGASKQIFSLPMHPYLQESDIIRICKVINDACSA